MTTTNLKVRHIVDKISAYLGGCTQKTICSLIAVSETALSQATDRPLAEVAENKVAKRLMSLLYILETLSRDETLSPSAIMKVLVTPCYPAEDGSYLDVTSAIQLGTVRNDLLVPIADAALKYLRSKYESEKRPLADGLYNQAKAG